MIHTIDESNMNQLLSKSWWMLAWRGAAALLFGILALIWPGMTLLVLVSLFAAFSLLSGAGAIVSALRHRSYSGWWLLLLLLLGLVSVAAGIIAVVNPAVTLFVLVLLMAANALITGVIDIVMAIRLRKKIEREWLLALTGAVSIVFGVLVFIFPPAGALALAFMVSMYATLIGILLLALALQARRWTKRSDVIARPPDRSTRPTAT
jgi:uncharacterized membrane protein HdeD (DUF308 family)